MTRTPPPDNPRSPQGRAADLRGDAFAKHTMSGPAHASVGARPSTAPPTGEPGSDHGPLLAEKLDLAASLSAAISHNPLKATEFGREGGIAPTAGEPVEPGSSLATASTVTETVSSDKIGVGRPPSGLNPNHAPLGAVRVDSGGWQQRRLRERGCDEVGSPQARRRRRPGGNSRVVALHVVSIARTQRFANTRRFICTSCRAYFPEGGLMQHGAPGLLLSILAARFGKAY
jgi:hypothetical protein